MLLTITTTHQPATDLGYLLVKHPQKWQTFSLSYGKAHVFYPTAEVDKCTAALLLDFDPVGLVRGRRRHGGGERTLAQYVNDRPYVASSFLSVAIAQVYGSALRGQSTDRAELAEQPIPLAASVSVVPCRGGERFLRSLFEPLGYEVTAERAPLDEKFPEWGEGPYFTVGLRGEVPLRDLLSHLYVLLPVLDNDKHYWVDQAELEKLLEKAGPWLADHPEREAITHRYLKHQRRLAREALERLMADDDPEPDVTEDAKAHEEQTLEEKISLNEQRLGSVVAALKQAGANRVVDLGCGEGRLLQALVKDKSFESIAGMDVSIRALEIAKDRIKLDRLPERQRKRIHLFQGALTYRDSRLAEFDAACVVEVIEHIDPSRLRAFEQVVFEFAKPQTVVITTPNSEYNVRFENLPAGKMRHRDHRFEWTRSVFEQWAQNIAREYSYSVRFLPVGPVDAEVGSPTQMGVFSR